MTAPQDPPTVDGAAALAALRDTAFTETGPPAPPAIAPDPIDPSPPSSFVPDIPAPPMIGALDSTVDALESTESDNSPEPEPEVLPDPAVALAEAKAAANVVKAGVVGAIGTAAQVAVHAAEGLIEEAVSNALQKLFGLLHILPAGSSIRKEASTIHPDGVYHVEVRGAGNIRSGTAPTLLHALEEAHGVDTVTKYTATTAS